MEQLYKSYHRYIDILSCWSFLPFFTPVKNATNIAQKNKKFNKKIIFLLRRFAIIITTDCACWLPVIVVKFIALSGLYTTTFITILTSLFVYKMCKFNVIAGVSISPSLYAWLAVLVLPVNSALNPILYTLTTAIFKQQFKRYCQALPNCALFTERTTANSQLTFESMSTSLGQFGSSKSNSGHKRSSNRCMSNV